MHTSHAHANYTRKHVHICIHTCRHACLHTCMLHTCLHTCMPTRIHPYIHACIYTCIHICIHTYRHYVICWEVAPAVPAQLHLPQTNHQKSVRALCMRVIFRQGGWLVAGASSSCHVHMQVFMYVCMYVCVYFLMSEAARKATPNTRGMYENVLRRMATVPKTPPVQNRCFPQPNPTLKKARLTSPHLNSSSPHPHSHAHLTSFPLSSPLSLTSFPLSSPLSSQLSSSPHPHSHPHLTSALPTFHSVRTSPMRERRRMLEGGACLYIHVECIFSPFVRMCVRICISVFKCAS